ncbi:hypothetical protein BO99DRAFT_369339, partial [Aspergillus violaceofuscus CBS 115571]
MHISSTLTLTATTVLCLLSSSLAIPSSTYSRIDTRDILRPRNVRLLPHPYPLPSRQSTTPHYNPNNSHQYIETH